MRKRHAVAFALAIIILFVVIIVLAMLVSVGGAMVVWCNLVVERGGKCFGIFG